MRLPWIIAEFGSSHEGSLNHALQGVEVAAQCDADAYKVQLWTSPERMRSRRRVWSPYAYEKGSVDPAWLPELAAACQKHEMDFMCTVYCPEDIQVVAPHVSVFKISSFEAGDTAFLAAHAQWDKPIIVSTGMMGDLPAYLKDHTTLHCVSAYPTPLEQAGLGCIRATTDGYSDHTKDERTGAWAVCAGAYIIEVHFCLDDTTDNCADVVVSHRPKGLERYIRYARLAWTAMGDGKRGPQEVELDNLKHRVTG